MTDQERKAMEMALEALENCAVSIDSEWGDCRSIEEMRETGEYTRATTKAIDALRQALAQPEQEPTVPDNMQDWANLDGDIAWHLIDRHADNWADIQKMMDEFVAAKIASAHLKHEWVSLTDDEIWGWFESNTAITRDGAFRIARAIEVKLREKNT